MACVLLFLFPQEAAAMEGDVSGFLGSSIYRLQFEFPTLRCYFNLKGLVEAVCNAEAMRDYIVGDE